MFTNFKRVLTFAFNDFGRNKGISIAAIFVLIITIMLVTGLLFFQGITSYLTSQLQSKIDVAAYFKADTQEQDILVVKDEIMKMTPNIKNIEYVSKEQALSDFTEKHKDNSVLIKALQEVGGNPFLSSLNITTNGEPQQYAQVANILQTSDFSNLVEKVVFPKSTIEKIYSFTSSINTYGIVLAIILILVAISVVFNTIKLVIENSKEEISTMKIVGASDWFVRGPFAIQGIIYGVIAFSICILISAGLAYFLTPEISAALPGFNMFDYFLTNLWIFVVLQLGFGIGVGAISALIIVKKHLDV